jgi:ubiquinone/menaquinone biosynthesis C-methylase UbiE
MAGIKQQVASQFGHAAEAYRTSSVHASGADLATMVQLAKVKGTEKVLDVGCGAGHTALAFAAVAREVVAVDLSAEMLGVAASLATDRGVENLTFRLGDAESLPAADGEFDLVVSRYSAHHWPHPQRALQEIRRVLKPGGRFILDDIVSWDDFTVDSYLQTIEVLRDPSHVRDHSLAQWIALFESVGFAVDATHAFDCPLEFVPWVNRINTPAVNVAALHSLMENAPAEVRQALSIDTKHDFALQGAIVVGSL